MFKPTAEIAAPPDAMPAPPPRRASPKYFFGAALWAAAGLFVATYLELISLGPSGLSVTAAALALLAFAGAWFVEQLDRRLKTFIHAAEQFSQGVRQVRLEVSHADGVASLTDAFNKMADATERRISELQNTLHQQRAIAEQVPDAMWVFDVGLFQLVDVNDNFSQLTGLGRNEIIGKTPMALSPPTQFDGRNTEAYARNVIERALQGEKVIAPWIILHRSGEPIACELRAVHLPSPDRTLLCGSLSDVRERRRTEAELSQRLRFENLIMLLSSGMTGLTAERLDAGIQQALADIGEFAQVDRSYVFRFDETATLVTCTHEWCAQGVPPQIGRLVDLPVRDFPWAEMRLLAGEVVHVPRVTELPPEAAAERREWQAEGIQSILLVPVRAADRVTGYVGFDCVRTEKRWPPEYMDVLRLFGEIVMNAIIRVQAETRLRQQNEMLAKTVAELERSNEELQQFAYISSHDLQEPLRSIGSFSELLRRNYGPQLDQRAQSYIEYITDASQRLHQLITGLLDYSRIGARSRPFEACDMNGVLKLALDNLAASIQDSGATITRESLPLVPGDAAQLTVLLQNLVGNALKFHGDAPPRVHISARPAGMPDAGWEFAVRDNGIGITEQERRKLFQIFRRLHRAEKYPGTGIGLAVCKRIVERHNGRIWIDANPDGGSILRFVLPAAIADARHRP